MKEIKIVKQGDKGRLNGYELSMKNLLSKLRSHSSSKMVW